MTSRYVYLAAIATILSGLLIGYHFSVISGAIVFIQPEFSLTSNQVEFVASSILLGGFLGTYAGGLLTDKIGRMKTLFAGTLLLLLGNIVLVFIDALTAFNIGRIIVGIGLGIYTVAGPLYLAEMSPSHSRGKLVALFQVGLLCGGTLGYLVGFIYDSEALWRDMFLVAIYPAAALLLFLLFLPESPYWHIRHGNYDKAKQLLQGIDAKNDVKKIIGDSLQHIALEKSSRIFCRAHAKPLFTGFTLAFLINIVGPAIVYMYTPDILYSLGVASKIVVVKFSYLLGVASLVATLIAVFLVDRIGRRPLLFIGAIISIIALILVVFFIFYPPVHPFVFTYGAILLFIAGYSLGIGPISFLVLSEIYPLKYRGKALGISHLIAFVGNYLVSRYFLNLAHLLQFSGAFLVFIGINILALLFFFFYVPETKGKTLEQIEELWTPTKQ
jgi:MFS transporter, SP family, galactose:H+ symporter